MVERRRRRQWRRGPEALEERCLLSTITVTSLEDNVAVDGDVTLREAVQAANTDRSVDGSAAGNGADTIRFADGLAGAIELDDVIVIKSAITVVGNGIEQTQLDGQRQRKIFRVVRANSDPPAFFEVQDLTMRDATSVKDGAAILADDAQTTLVLRRVVVTNVHSLTGAIYVQSRNGQVTIEDSEFVGNLADADGGALAIGGDGLTMDVRNSTFRDNRAVEGGAITFEAGVSAEFVESTFEGNRATRNGGAIENRGQATIVVRGSEFLSNRATRNGGAIFGHEGSDDGSSTIDVFESSFVGNRAGADGGAIRVYEGSINNSTVSGNTSKRAAVFRADVISSTVVENVGVGVGGVFAGDREAVVVSSIVANNVGTIPDLRKGVIDVRDSLIGVNVGGDLQAGSPSPDGNYVGTTSAPMAPGLLPLVNFGQRRWVHPLKPGSVAINNGTNHGDLATDQRGEDRVQSASADIGAFEGTLRGLLTVADAEVVERDSGTRKLRFRIEFVGELDSAFTVGVRTLDGTATLADDDYRPIERTLSFEPLGPQVLVVHVPVNGDSAIELDENVILELHSPSATDVMIVGRGVGTIRTDDTSASITFADGVLTATGTGFCDKILFEQAGGILSVSANEKTGDFLVGDLERIVVLAGEGNDIVKGPQITVPLEVHGGPGDDIIKTGAASDTILAGAGNDDVRSGAGDDSVQGESGDDIVRGQDGNDNLDGGNERDTLIGENGSDTLTGGTDRDRLVGGPGDDDLDGGSNKDTLTGGSGNDIAGGGSGDDSLSGGSGNDQLMGQSGSDTMSGGNGSDTLTGGESKDFLAGDNGADSLVGGSADDVLFGGRGRDTLMGDAGEDLLVAGFVTVQGTAAEKIRRAIYEEWFLGSGDHDTRQNNIRRSKHRTRNLDYNLIGLERDRNQTVFDDGHSDRVTGGAGRDYFAVAFDVAKADIFDAESHEHIDRI